ncbi:MAG: helix-turn-helix domain-containing protein [Myxococcaceae bacterium]
MVTPSHQDEGPIRGTEALGRLVRQRRKEQGITLAQAAGLAGVGVRFLLELEHGKPTASLGKALQVLDRIGLDLWITPRGAKPPRSDR